MTPNFASGTRSSSGFLGKVLLHFNAVHILRAVQEQAACVQQENAYCTLLHLHLLGPVAWP